MPYEFVKLEKLSGDKKKYMVVLKHNVKGVDKEKIIKFGATGYSDYPTYYLKDGKDVADKKKKAYIARHKVNEDFSKAGIDTAGWWALNILWSEPTINESLSKIKKEYFKK